MRILRRLRLFWRAQFSRGGPSESAMDRMLEQVEAQLGEARTQLSLCQAEEQRLFSVMVEEQRAAERMLSRARQALALTREELAREAAARHLQALRQAARYHGMWEQQRADVKRVQSLVEILEGKRADVEYSRQRISTRQQLARARQALLHTLYSEQGDGLEEQAEEAARSEEYTVDAYQQILTEQSVHPLELASDPMAETVEGVLAQLRRELSPGSSAE